MDDEDYIRQLREICDDGGDIATNVIPDALARTKKAGCIALAGRLGIARRVTTKTEAVAAIVRWVRELPIARESIAY